jgi:hypothetical protein
MPKVTLTDIQSGSGVKDTYNANNDVIEQAFDNTLSRNGATPNGMGANLDMNSYKVINLTDGVNNQDAVTVNQLNTAIVNAGSGIISQDIEKKLGSDAVSKKFTLTGVTYSPGLNSLSVYKNGLRLRNLEDYVETSSTEVTLVSTPNNSDEFDFVTNDSVTSLVSDAASVTYTPAGTGAVATNVQDKLRDHLSVLDFGATGDGVTDDTTAVKAAITEALASGKPLYFPVGTYNLSTWTYKLCTSKLHIFGDGAGRTIIKGEGTQNFINIEQGLIARDITFTDFETVVRGIPASGATTPADEIVAESCIFKDSRDALYLQGVVGDDANSGVERIIVRNSQFTGLERWGVYAIYKRMDLGVIDGNVFKDFEGSSSVQAVFWGYDVWVPSNRGHVSITNNFVSGFLSTYAGEAEVHAFMVHEALSCYISGNRIYDLQNSDAAGGDCEGIYIRTVQHAIVTSNTLKNIRNGVDGAITVKEFCDYIEITDNFIDNTDYVSFDGNHGVVSYTGYSVISRNTITNVGGIGVNAVQNTGNYVLKCDDNWIENVGGFCGIFAVCKSNSSISRNWIINVKRNYATNVIFGSLAAYGDDACGIMHISSNASPARVAIDENRIVVNVDVSNSPAYGIRCHAITNLGNVSCRGNVLDSTTQDYKANVTGADIHEIYTQDLGGYRVSQGLTNQTGRFTMHDETGAIGGGIAYNHQTEVFSLLAGGGTTRVSMAAAGHFYPAADNTQTLGKSGNRWSEVHAGNGTINTSDERLKQAIREIDAKVLKAWGKVNYVQYKFKDAVQKKGDGARTHIGLIAQRVKEAFESEGIDPFAYGILCWDSWGDEYAPVTDKKGYAELDEEGKVKKRKIVSAGEAYGIRYEQALALECAYLRSKLAL